MNYEFPDMILETQVKSAFNRIEDVRFVSFDRYDYGSLNTTRQVMQRNIDAGIPLVSGRL